MDRLAELIAIRCPECDKDVEQTLRWFYRNSACNHCGSDMTVIVYRTLNAIDDRFRPAPPNPDHELF